MQSIPTRRRSVLAAALAGITVATGVAGPALAADPVGSLSGVVRDTRGAAVPDAVISVFLDPAGDPVQEFHADDRGRFRATGLKAGGYRIRISMAGWSEWAPGRITDPGQARIYPVRANRTTVADSTVTAAGIIAGRFFAPNGEPAAHAGVYVTNVATGAEHGGQTTADGTFRIRVQPDQTFVVSYAPGLFAQYVPHTFDRAKATNFTVRSGRTVRIEDRAIDVSGITGRLTDAAGAPAGGVYVTFVNVDTAVESETSTAADGRYDFTGLLVPGRYKVRFTAPGGSQYSHRKPDYDSADVITLTPGVTTVVDEQLLWVPTV